MKQLWVDKICTEIQLRVVTPCCQLISARQKENGVFVCKTKRVKKSRPNIFKESRKNFGNWNVLVKRTQKWQARKLDDSLCKLYFEYFFFLFLFFKSNMAIVAQQRKCYNNKNTFSNRHKKCVDYCRKCFALQWFTTTALQNIFVQI